MLHKFTVAWRRYGTRIGVTWCIAVGVGHLTPRRSAVQGVSCPYSQPHSTRTDRAAPRPATPHVHLWLWRWGGGGEMGGVCEGRGSRVWGCDRGEKRGVRNGGRREADGVRRSLGAKEERWGGGGSAVQWGEVPNRSKIAPLFAQLHALGVPARG